MTFCIYTARWWSSVDWTYNEAELLAASEAQVRAWVDEQTLPQYRVKPHYGADPRPEKDSLTIAVVKAIDSLPFVLKHHDS